MRERAGDGIVAGSIAAVLGGAPSTFHAAATGGDALEATRAAGSVLLSDEERTGPLVAAAVPVHGALSLVWGVALSVLLPRSNTLAWGVAGGLAIAALDLGVVGRVFPRIRALAQGPQVADHICFGVVVAAVVRRRREARLVT